MSNPTYRDKTQSFNFKRKLLHDIIIHGDGIMAMGKMMSPESHKENLIPKQLDDNTNKIANKPVLINMYNNEPIYMELLESVDYDIDEIERQIGMLRKYHSLKQRVVFEDDKSIKYDQNIQNTTKLITQLFKRSKMKLQKIALDKGSNDNESGYQEKTIRYNIMRSRATTIQELTKTFRSAQRKYLQSIHKKQRSSIASIHDRFDNELAIINDFENIAMNGMNKKQEIKLKEIEKNASKKTQEILNIAKSVHELAQLFNELSVLIVEQGSLLDRIDYNVEQTVDTLKKAESHIKKAAEHQKRSRSALCIVVLFCLIVLAGFILVIRSI